MLSLKELIFVSLENWDDIWRRNQFLCDGLIRRHPDLRILFVEPPKDVSNALRKGRWRQLLEPRLRRVGTDDRIVCTRALKFFPNSVPAARRLNERMGRKHIERMARRLGFEAPVLWINAHSAGHLAGQLGESAVIYDVTDDWTTFEESSPACLLTRIQDRALCQAADAVIVCSERLLAIKQPLADSVHLIPNGVDSAHYRDVLNVHVPRTADTLSWKRPVLGYTGSIHSERVDLALIETLARRLPHSTIAMVGPIMLGDSDRRRLESLENVVLTGPRKYSEIPAYMRAFDVCITPHLVTPFTESLNPIKLWEYLAGGKPIISTPVAGFREHPEFVHLATDAEGFATALTTALRESVEESARRRAFAALHSWDSRLDTVENVISQAIAPEELEVLHV